MTETAICTFQNVKNDENKRLLSTVGYIQDHVEVSRIYNPVDIIKTEYFQVLSISIFLNQLVTHKLPFFLLKCIIGRLLIGKCMPPTIDIFTFIINHTVSYVVLV